MITISQLVLFNHLQKSSSFVYSTQPAPPLGEPPPHRTAPATILWKEGVLSFGGPVCLSVSTEAREKKPREETRLFTLTSPLTTAQGVTRVRRDLVRTKGLHYEMRAFPLYPTEVCQPSPCRGQGSE